MLSKLSLEKAAAEFRSNCGYNAYNPVRIKSLLLQLNVLAIFKNMEGSFSGMSLKIDDHKFMLINSSHSIGRQHFTILHELYHLYIQKDFEHVICNPKLGVKEKREEDRADIFAANLMLPREGLLKYIPDEELKKDNISIGTILALEQMYSCSHSAMLIRLQGLNFITEIYKEKLTPEVKKTATQYGYDTTLYEAGNENLVIGDYGTKAKRLFDNDIISKTHYIELMRDLGFDLEE